MKINVSQSFSYDEKMNGVSDAYRCLKREQKINAP